MDPSIQKITLAMRIFGECDWMGFKLELVSVNLYQNIELRRYSTSNPASSVKLSVHIHMYMLYNLYTELA
jgi:hypothetical protein